MDHLTIHSVFQNYNRSSFVDSDIAKECAKVVAKLAKWEVENKKTLRNASRRQGKRSYHAALVVYGTFAFRFGLGLL
jgi:hypothetical protein